MAHRRAYATILVSPLSQAEILRSEYALFVLTTLFVIARAAIHGSRRRTVEFQDFFIYLAYALYVGLWSEYIIAVPYLFKIDRVKSGDLAPYAGLLQEAAYMSRLIWSAQMLFYLSLFSVKMSLLTLYRKLLTGLGIYNKIWWGIVVFTSLATIGCIITSLTSCKSLKAFFREAACGTPEESRNIVISLYYAYAADVITDLMVMFLPIRLVWNLQMERVEKTGIIILFCGGFVCIAFSSLRVFKVGMRNSDAVAPNAKWLTLWTIIEVSIAVIIGCSPAFASLIRFSIKSKRSTYDGRGYHKQGDETVVLETIGSSNLRPRNIDDSALDSIYDEEVQERLYSQTPLQRNPLYRGNREIETRQHDDQVTGNKFAT